MFWQHIQVGNQCSVPHFISLIEGWRRTDISLQAHLIASLLANENTPIHTREVHLLAFLPLYWACDKTLQLNSQGFSHFNSSPLNGYLAFITCQNASVFTCSINSTSSTWKANNNKHVQWLCYLSKPLCMLNKGMVVINLCLEVGRPGPITWGQYGGEDHACPVISWHSYGSNWLAQPSDKERPDGSTDRGKLERMF